MKHATTCLVPANWQAAFDRPSHGFQMLLSGVFFLTWWKAFSQEKANKSEMQKKPFFLFEIRARHWGKFVLLRTCHHYWMPSHKSYKTPLSVYLLTMVKILMASFLGVSRSWPWRWQFLQPLLQLVALLGNVTSQL